MNDATSQDTSSPDADAPPVDPALLELLVCPVTRSPLRIEDGMLVAERPEGFGLRYPIRNGIPVLLADEATLPEGVESLEAFKTRFRDQIPE